VSQHQSRPRALPGAGALVYRLVSYLSGVEQVFRRGLAIFRWGAWLWIVATMLIYWHTDYLRHKVLAVSLVALALLFTILQTALLPAASRFQNRRRVAIGEVTVGFAMIVLDGVVRRHGVGFTDAPSLGSYWPVVGLMGLATYLPIWAAGAGGVVFGVGRLLSSWLNGFPPTALTGGEWISVINDGLFSALAAMSVSALMKLLRNAETELAFARAREEVARTLHDGVLQTLAIVERRSDDESLARLAREQERDLRRYLFEQNDQSGAEELGIAVMNAAARYEDRYGGRVHVVLAPDLPVTRPEQSKAVLGAVGEALNNAGKHGESMTVTIYLEPVDDGIFCSVKDDGKGFDPQTVIERAGMTRSIKARIVEVGGRVEFKSKAGAGAEVLMWLP